MSQISFCTSLKYSENEQSFCNDIRESVDSYFYLGGKKVSVINVDKETNIHHVSFIKAEPGYITTVLKVISYLTIVLPIFFLILKAVLRAGIHIKLIENESKIFDKNPILLNPIEIPNKANGVDPEPTPLVLPQKTLDLVEEKVLINEAPVEIVPTEDEIFNGNFELIKKSNDSREIKDKKLQELAQDCLFKNQPGNALKAIKEMWGERCVKDQLLERVLDAYFLKGAYKEAFNIIKEVWDRKSQDALFGKLAEAHFVLNQYNEAFLVIKEVWFDSIFKDNFLIKLSETHLQMNDLSEAFKVANEVKNNDQKDVLLGKIAQIYIKDGFKEKVKEIAEKISDKNPLQIEILRHVLSPEELYAHQLFVEVKQQVQNYYIHDCWDEALRLIAIYPQYAEKLSTLKELIEEKKNNPNHPNPYLQQQFLLPENSLYIQPPQMPMSMLF
jgi:tetratricopeptide (TPR) repeat protein